MPITDPDGMRALLTGAKVIAIVGHSDKPHRISYRIGQYLKQAGYTVYPVNPTVAEIDGEPCYAALADVPEPIDIVDVFRRSAFLRGAVEEAVAVSAKAVWAQLGVHDDEAARIAEEAGLQVVMNRCIKVEHHRLVKQ